MATQTQAQSQSTQGSQLTPSPEQAQNTMDMLSIALAQTSRDPGLMAQVQLQIQQRQRTAHEQELAALASQTKLATEAMQQKGETERSQLAAGTQLRSTQMAVESRERVATMEEEGRTRRTVFEQQQETERSQGRQVQDRSLKAAEIGQKIMGEAQDLYAKLISGDKQASMFGQAMMLGNADELALIKTKQDKGEKLTDAETTTLNRQAIFAGMGSGGAMTREQAMEVTTQFLNTRLQGLDAVLPEARPMVEAMWTRHLSNLDPVDEVAKGAKVPEAKVLELSTHIVGRLFQPDRESPEQLLNLQLAIGNLAKQYPDDPQVQEDIITGVMTAVAERVVGEDPDEVARYMAMVDGIIGDGMNVEEYEDLGEILKDMGVPAFQPGASKGQPTWMNVQAPGTFEGMVGEIKTRREEKRARFKARRAAGAARREAAYAEQQRWKREQIAGSAQAYKAYKAQGGLFGRKKPKEGE